MTLLQVMRRHSNYPAMQRGLCAQRLCHGALTGPPRAAAQHEKVLLGRCADAIRARSIELLVAGFASGGRS